ncbi:alpha/beta hydrolase [Gemmiger formicilis]|uniref:alpha/beta fold hydrolase n=1 Tax=Gemmiger formicilis TaxID=745368 RepID=UPI001959E8B9|nr:alpha/beta hydrolase [Gemmiger formicilis]MBM6914111.1 alpha/beta hydrolase [Gemmiger formicilis]
MATKIFVHGSGHKATSWEKTISYMTDNEDIVCPNLSSILEGKEASYENLYSSFVKYCNEFDGQIHLRGLSLGGILALNFALDFPQKVKTLVLIGTPYKVPKAAFSFQNIIFRFLPKSIFETMAFDKKNTFALGDTMKNLDFSDRVKNIKCPTLILCGKKDSANMKSADYLSQNIRSAELKIIENTGHVVNEENPKALADILNEYYLQNP